MEVNSDSYYDISEEDDVPFPSLQYSRQLSSRNYYNEVKTILTKPYEKLMLKVASAVGLLTIELDKIKKLMLANFMVAYAIIRQHLVLKNFTLDQLSLVLGYIDETEIDYSNFVIKSDSYESEVGISFDSYTWLKKQYVLTDERYKDASSDVYDKYREFIADPKNNKFREFLDSIAGARTFVFV